MKTWWTELVRQTATAPHQIVAIEAVEFHYGNPHFATDNAANVLAANTRKSKLATMPATKTTNGRGTAKERGRNGSRSQRKW